MCHLHCLIAATKRPQGIPTVVASGRGDDPTLRHDLRRPKLRDRLQARSAVMARTISALKAQLRLAVAIATGHPLAAAFPVN